MLKYKCSSMVCYRVFLLVQNFLIQLKTSYCECSGKKNLIDIFRFLFMPGRFYVSNSEIYIKWLIFTSCKYSLRCIGHAVFACLHNRQTKIETVLE